MFTEGKRRKVLREGKGWEREKGCYRERSFVVNHERLFVLYQMLAPFTFTIFILKQLFIASISQFFVMIFGYISLTLIYVQCIQLIDYGLW